MSDIEMDERVRRAKKHMLDKVKAEHSDDERAAMAISGTLRELLWRHRNPNFGEHANTLAVQRLMEDETPMSR
jgi:hypothetical protein